MGNLGGWLQIVMGLFGLAQQAYQLVTGHPFDVTHSVISAGLVGGGAQHLSNGKNNSTNGGK